MQSRASPQSIPPPSQMLGHPTRGHRFRLATQTWRQFLPRRPSFKLTYPFVLLLCLYLFLRGWSHDEAPGLEEEVTPAVGVTAVDDQYFLHHISPHPARSLPRNHQRALPDTCIESWIIDGEFTCTSAGAQKVDVVWTWVNGTDPRWEAARSHWQREGGLDSPEKHFREQNELLYSMRSVSESLGPHLGQVRLVISDYPYDPLSDARLPSLDDFRDPDRTVVAQVPVWVNLSAARGGEGSVIRLVTHSDIFRLPGPDTAETEREWRSEALPTFNSLAIESRLAWLPDLGEAAVYLNDDCFWMVQHGAADFHSPLYGTVLRFDLSPQQRVISTNYLPEEGKPFDNGGENPSLGHACHLLSQRFSSRARPYVQHAAKSITRIALDEASVMFRHALNVSATRRFREDTGRGQVDVHMLWLATSLTVERWREGLLWTFVMANLGTRDHPGVLGPRARQQLREVLKVGPAALEVDIRPGFGKRLSIDPDRVASTLGQVAWDKPKGTYYLFSSLDGDMGPVNPLGLLTTYKGKCNLNLEKCFGPFWTQHVEIPADELFKSITFQQPECGNCRELSTSDRGPAHEGSVIMALVNASGEVGLSAFFPPIGTTHTVPTEQTFEPDQASSSQAYLPLTATWEEADFSLNSVLGTFARPGEVVDLRRFCSLLLYRYLYVSSRSNIMFQMLTTLKSATRILRMISFQPKISMLGLNDDITEHYGEIKRLMGEWFQGKWGRKAVWERSKS